MVSRLAFSTSAAQRFVDDTRGSYTVWGLFWILVFLFVGGFAVDTSNLWRTKAMLQGTADAAAYAAARQVHDQPTAIADARSIAELNMPSAKNGGHVLPQSSITFGTWNDATKTFSNGAAPADAVQVVTSRHRDTTNTLPTFLMHMIGVVSWDIKTSSIAINRNSRYENNTVASEGNTNVGGGCSVDATVIHGQQGASVGSDCSFANGAQVTAPTPGPQVPNVAPNSPMTLADATATVSRANLVTSSITPLYNELWSHYSSVDTTYTGTSPVAAITETPGGVSIHRIDASVDTVTIKPSTPVTQGGAWVIQSGDPIQADTLYLVDGDVVFTAGSSMIRQNFAIVASGTITFSGGGDLEFSQVLFMAGEDIVANDGVQFGRGPQGGHCSSQHYSTYLFALDQIAIQGFANGTNINGTLAAALSDIDIGADMSDSGSFYIESAGDITIGANMVAGGCADPKKRAMSNHLNIPLPRGPARITALDE